MKTILMLILVSFPAFGQGTLVFKNNSLTHPVTGQLYDALAYNFLDAPVGPEFSAGLYLLNGASESLLAVTPFRSNRPGVLLQLDRPVQVPGVLGGQEATFRVKVWETAAGSYENALQSGLCSGIFPTTSGNNALTIVLTDPVPFLSYAQLNGLLPLTLNCIPEPSTSAIILLGALLLLRRRSS